MSNTPQIIFAVDTPDVHEVHRLLYTLADVVPWVKIGYSALTAFGLKSITRLCKQYDYRILMDLKYHDTPSVVARNVRMLTEYEIDMLTVHVAGGHDMLQEAREGAHGAAIHHGVAEPQILGVTVLTSDKRADKVLPRAKLAQAAGLAGVVAAPQEIRPIRDTFGDDFLIVTPGIRPADYPAQDHQRYATPNQAATWGADYLVIGRPILEAVCPVSVVTQIQSQLSLFAASLREPVTSVAIW